MVFLSARTWLWSLGLCLLYQTLVCCADDPGQGSGSGLELGSEEDRTHTSCHLASLKDTNVLFDYDGTHIVYNCSNEGHLMLLVGDKVRTCEDGKLTGEEPHCEYIPSISFQNESTSVNMKEKVLSIPVVISSAVVRPFLVEVYVENSPTSTVENSPTSTVENSPTSTVENSFTPTVAVERLDFQVLNKALNFTQDKEKYDIQVNLTDTKISGRTKTFVLCLNVSNDAVTNEQRAELGETSCITVHIQNTYSTAVSFLEEVYVFTKDTQSLSFSVGYRDCNISLLLDISKAIEEVQFTIPNDCGEGSGMCIVNLHNQDQNFPVTEAMIGEYTARVVQAGDDCKIVAGAKESLTTTIMITLTSQQFLESATSISFSNSEYSCLCDENGATENMFIPIHFDPEPKYPFKLEIKSKDEGIIGWGDVESGDSDEPIDITDFVNGTASSSCKLFDQFDLQLVPQTAPYVAKVATVNGSATLTIGYSIAVGFENTEDIETDLSAIVVTANRCFDHLNDYVQVKTEQEETTLKLDPVSTTDDRSWRVEGTLLVPPLENRTLSLELTQQSDISIAPGSVSITYVTITTIQFKETSYTAQDGSSSVEVTIIPTSSAPRHLWKKLNNTNLKDLVEVSPSDIANLNTATARDGAWNISVVANGSVTLELKLKDKFKQYIALGDMNTCTIEGVKPPVQPPAKGTDSTDSSTAKSSFSFTAIIVVFVIVLALGVAVYVAYSKKDQIIDWVKGTGGGGGGRGSGGHKQSRTRTRGRGAYKKLPTSVQDAMKHND